MQNAFFCPTVNAVLVAYPFHLVSGFQGFGDIFLHCHLGDDALSVWAKNRKECFLPSEISLQERVREILAADRGLVEGGKKKNCADPFVIALAQEKSQVRICV